MIISSFLTGCALTVSKLADFAERTYPVELVTGNFKAKTNKGRSMEKALAIIQFKLEEQTIGFPAVRDGIPAVA